ncbi:hypothetical protein TNCV_2045171 [Trichonephila clavipes]|uniref:Uncharacterized protein n=1 Tax=Trichonephila clavipes TaxID=2585209 RepID=A0A8X6T403_TRICX|nr:hypothetical protein TNCV_2045171 [Trichonephila clavipes]
MLDKSGDRGSQGTGPLRTIHRVLNVAFKQVRILLKNSVLVDQETACETFVAQLCHLHERICNACLLFPHMSSLPSKTSAQLRLAFFPSEMHHVERWLDIYCPVPPMQPINSALFLFSFISPDYTSPRHWRPYISIQ